MHTGGMKLRVRHDHVTLHPLLITMLTLMRLIIMFDDIDMGNESEAMRQKRQEQGHCRIIAGVKSMHTEK